MADCRRCIYFRSRRDMSPRERDEAVKWIARYRPGKPLLGYCSFFSRPVTYYRGKCAGYREKPVFKPKRLFEFLSLDGQGVVKGFEQGRVS